jgi:hypothetical protein
MCCIQQNMNDSKHLEFLAVSSQLQSSSLSNKRYLDPLYFIALKDANN